MSTKGSALFDQPAKVGVKFRSPTRDIDCRNISFLEGLDALLCRFSGHTFGPIGPGIDMAVPAGLIAELADIDLKDCDSCGARGDRPIRSSCLSNGGQRDVFPSTFNCSAGEARGFCRPSRVGAIGFFVTMPRAVYGTAGPGVTGHQQQFPFREQATASPLTCWQHIC